MPTTTRIELVGQPLSLDDTLSSGQAFRWGRHRDGAWEGVAGHHFWRLRRDKDLLLAQCWPGWSDSEAHSFLGNYFALDLDWQKIGRGISRVHSRAADAVRRFPGLRLLRQDPGEALLSFSIATASHVPRITRSISALCARYGRPLEVIEGITRTDFPTACALLEAPRSTLASDCNLAYRADHIMVVASELIAHGETWLERLRDGAYRDAHAELDAIAHIGPKVADCVCLMGLGHWQAVPLDTHVWAISRQLFSTAVPTRTLTPKTYRLVGEKWRELFGEHAGVAQQWLFHARRVDLGRVPRP